MELKDYIGLSTGAGTVHLERGSVARFAQAVTDDNPVYSDQRAARDVGFDAPPLPPTWTFAASFQGARLEEQPENPVGPEGNPMRHFISQMMQQGGMVLHGEQEFHYHQLAQCGEVLHWRGSITDAYTRESNGKVMTFLVMETVFSNTANEPVVTEIFNLIHRR